jgi:hypothetical protein
MISIMCLMLATFGLGSALADMGDQKSGLEVQNFFNKNIKHPSLMDV